MIFERYGLLGQVLNRYSSLLQTILTHKPDARQVQILWLKPPALLLHGSTGHGDINTAVILKWSVEQCKL